MSVCVGMPVTCAAASNQPPSSFLTSCRFLSSSPQARVAPVTNIVRSNAIVEPTAMGRAPRIQHPPPKPRQHLGGGITPHLGARGVEAHPARVQAGRGQLSSRWRVAPTRGESSALRAVKAAEERREERTISGHYEGHRAKLGPTLN